jgi:hypothetical protein
VLSSPVAALPYMLQQDRKQAGWWVGQAVWRLGLSEEVPRARGRHAIAEFHDSVLVEPQSPDLFATPVRPRVASR